MLTALSTHLFIKSFPISNLPYSYFILNELIVANNYRILNHICRYMIRFLFVDSTRIELVLSACKADVLATITKNPFAHGVGFEPTLGLLRLVNSQDRSANYGNPYFCGRGGIRTH